MAETEWVNVKVPKLLVEELEKVLEDSSYRNVPHFVDVTVREKMRQLKEAKHDATA